MRCLTMNQPMKFSDQVDFRTPGYLFDYINDLIRPIEYDGACVEGVNNLATPLQLEDEWPNGVIYSNPPFDMDSIIKWAKKGYEHSRRHPDNIHYLLIPNKLTQVAFQNECKNLIDRIIFFGGRVDFPSSYATKGGTSRNGTILIVQHQNSYGVSWALLSEIKKRYSNED
jgi:hypothetical protein